MAKKTVSDRVKREDAHARAKIAKAYGKLAKRFRHKAEKATARSDAADKTDVKDALARRAKLFAQAEKELEGKVARLGKAA